MYCRQCGTKVDENDMFCVKCGFDLHEGVAKTQERRVPNQKISYSPPQYTVQTIHKFGTGKIVSGVIMALIGIIINVSNDSANSSYSTGWRYYLDSDYRAQSDLLGAVGVILIILGIILIIVGLIGKKETNTYRTLQSNGVISNNMMFDNGPATGWRCAKCGNINADYVGTCGCGNLR